MNQRNFEKEFQTIVDGLVQNNQKKKLLLHACCAPCATACLERVKDCFDVTVYFYNPNMDTLSEFELRKNELIKLCESLGVKCVIEDYQNQEFLSAVVGFENYPEGGKRCEKCFDLRLNKTAELAKSNGFEYFATTLTVSPLKNAPLINAVGERLGKQFGIEYLVTDFKKKGGYQRSIELSKQYGLYRQNYCGCKFSKI